MTARLVLEVARVDAGGLSVGQRFVPPLSFGRDPDNDVSWFALPRHACRFEFNGPRLLLRVLQNLYGLYVNAVMVRTDTELKAGDRLQLAGGVDLEVKAVDPRPPFVLAHPQLVAAIEDDPGDDGRWRVFADRLLDVGDPLGARMATGSGGSRRDAARELAPLATELTDGNLAVEWRFGFARRAVLRAVEHWVYRWPWQWSLQRLLVHPLFHWLEELEVDLASFGKDAATSDHLIAALEHVAAEGPLPLLRHVKVGPLERDVKWKYAQAWHQCVAAHPKLAATDGPVLPVGEASLVKPQGERVALQPGAPVPVAEGVHVRLELGQWWVTDTVAQRVIQQLQYTPMKVNGRTCVRQRLRPGDVIEPRPGVSVRFEMSGG
ncbi:MAG: FHA domain-containing protein [Myxococcaceae bacterium]|nr:FHA domain-containing protein [Myxococcaceae bacterium]